MIQGHPQSPLEPIKNGAFPEKNTNDEGMGEPQLGSILETLNNAL
jgi:hypothetical protein